MDKLELHLHSDLLEVIIRKRRILENMICNAVSKDFFKIFKKVFKEQFCMFLFFKRFKKKTTKVNPNKRDTYYTLKNKYINREEAPILNF